MININLLPEEIRENIDYSKKNKKLLKYFRTLIVMCLLFLSAFIFFYVFLMQNNSYFLKKIKESEENISEYQGVFDEAKKLDEKVKAIEKIKDKYRFWSKLNYALNRTVPEGLYIQALEPLDKSLLIPNEKNIVTQSDNIKMKITGYSKTKNDIGLFRDALSAQEGLKIVNVETAKEDVPGKNNFSITLFLNKTALEKGEK
ncbi:hypothetical protein C4544_01645 [candidate division WS5 bacterium]|uniref:PilN domain-containing protein n=1 Tax=candidate division WS5 bacterium TaxID=2093353 RepID=A0A419DFF5_9BACT|nr:MAG: hypothetical protein C4544_01645 [candidate division WS5 bacterium]